MNIPKKLVESWSNIQGFEPEYIDSIIRKKNANGIRFPIIQIALLLFTFFLLHLWPSNWPLNEMVQKQMGAIPFIILGLMTYFLIVRLICKKARFGLRESELKILNRLLIDLKRLREISGVKKFKAEHFETCEEFPEKIAPEIARTKLAKICWLNLRQKARSLRSQQQFLRTFRDTNSRDVDFENTVAELRISTQADFDLMARFGLRPKNSLFGDLFNPKGPVIDIEALSVWDN